MQKKSLIQTNPYLLSPEQYRKALVTNVSSSTAVETGATVASIANTLNQAGLGISGYGVSGTPVSSTTKTL